MVLGIRSSIDKLQEKGHFKQLMASEIVIATP